MSGLLFVAALVLGVWALFHSGPGGGTAVTTRVDRTTVTARTSRASSTGNAPPRPSAGMRIRGTVVDTLGAPVAGARVSASLPEPGQTLSELPCPEGTRASYEDARDPSTQGRKLPSCILFATGLVQELVGAREGEVPVYAETTAGADGAFLLEALPEGPLTLWAFGERNAVLRAGIPAGSEGVELVLETGFAKEGRVIGEGSPIAGATVTVFSPSQSRFFDTTTGADGSFRVGPLPMDNYFAFVAKDGWFPEVVQLLEEKQEVTLHRPGRLSGRVLSGGVPVPGIEVRVEPGELIPGDNARRVTTDGEGRFNLTLPEGRYTLITSRDGRYALSRLEVGTTTPEVVLELGSALHAAGTVSDDSGRPVAGAVVKAGSSKTYGLILRAVTGTDGRYRLGPVEPDFWSFIVEAPGYLDLGAEVHPVGTDPRPVDFTLTRAASVTGRVSDAEGRPLPGIQLIFVRPGPADAPENTEPQESTWTDAEGRFVLDAQEPGDYRIDVLGAPYVDASFPVRAPARDVHLTLHAGASVEGTVVDAHGLLLGGFLVELQAPEAQAELERGRLAFTDERGHFLLQGVKPGRYVLVAGQERDDVTRRVWREVELHEGERLQVELRLEPERTLSGIVVDEAGQPLKYAFVRALLPDDEDQPAWKREARYSHHGPPAGVATEPDGRFTLRGLTEATYDVSAFKPGYRSTEGRNRDSQRIGAGTTEVRFVLRREPHITGRLVDPEGAPVRGFRVNGIPHEDPNGAFSLPAGQVKETLVFEADGLATLVQRVQAHEGGADVDLGVLRMKRGRTLRGRVVDAETSEPIPHISFFLRARESLSNGQHVADTERDGTFELTHVDLEDSTLSAEHLYYLTQQLTPGPEQEELTVRMQPGPQVEVTVRDREGRPRTARVYFHADFHADSSWINPGMGVAYKGQLLHRGQKPGPHTVWLEPESDRERDFPVFLPQRVVVPATGRVQLHFEEQSGGATVTLRVPDGTGSNVMLLPGTAPAPSRLENVRSLTAQSLPARRTRATATFEHVPAGPATILYFHPGDSYRFHREELDVPPSGTLSRELTPVWQAFARGTD
ncbi:carboxypeptidase regulatory-like domain-containing protein [Pyxidicoccus parkwayensis]|uniref:Carboxypeptidase regulatory-like domain-containing protein n=1 Tax=Pyxidicoccus parkwayensis TaxID=2813578 RepID=A0ABX7NQY9_9BACT|nr:carboxypeptidase regulatory-like domain-containing protein [Pyxidicoccus parkwaysis]QSQ21281.1 carboxypeptidase regulatory-like domain-containing protein [Pyxidicoccus parkwaysis]